MRGNDQNLDCLLRGPQLSHTVFEVRKIRMEEAKRPWSSEKLFPEQDGIDLSVCLVF